MFQSQGKIMWLHQGFITIFVQNITMQWLFLLGSAPCTLKAQAGLWTFIEKCGICIFFFPHEMTSMAKARTSYNLLPGIIKDRYWRDRFSWPLLIQKTCTFHILSFDNMPRGRKQIRDVRWWPDSWNMDNTGC